MDTTDNPLKVGLFGIGLDTYWTQFPGLHDRLVGFTETIARKLGSCGVRVINLGIIDTPEKSLAAGHEFRKADVDLIFLYVTTYALSSTVLPAVRRAKAPVIILNLSPAGRFDPLSDLVPSNSVILQHAGYLEKWNPATIEHVCDFRDGVRLAVREPLSRHLGAVSKAIELVIVNCRCGGCLPRRQQTCSQYCQNNEH